VAKKITGIVAGVSWVLVAIFWNFPTDASVGARVQGGLWLAGLLVGIFSLIALVVMATIDYARRPR
jgi:hypothetical protein